MKEMLINLKQEQYNVLLKSALSVALLILGLISNGILQFIFCLLAYLIIGFDILKEAVVDLAHKQFFGETFLMSIATIGAFMLKQYPEAVAVMLFYRLGEMLQDLAVEKSKRSITKLLDIRPKKAEVVTENGLVTTLPKDVLVGQVIEVKPGQKIALDGVVISGKSYLNTAALTGESTPRLVSQGQEVLSGMIVLDGLLHIRVQKKYADSAVAKILELVQNASQKKAVTENFITRFSKIYTPVVVLAAIFLALGLPLITKKAFSVWIYRALVFLVISCPCALVLSIPLSFFGGIGAASSKGVLVKGGNYLEALTQLKTIAFDKTGTLTKGQFMVTDVVLEAKISHEKFLTLLATAEQASLHPIGQCIFTYCKAQKITPKTALQASDQAGFGVSVTTKDETIYVGNAKLMAQKQVAIKKVETPETIVHVACNNQYLGFVKLADTLKADAKQTLGTLKNLGLKLVMLTGDKKDVAQAIAKEVKIDEVYANLLPEEKLAWLEQLKKELKKGEKIAFVGDGINDTPVLAQADIGISMGGLGSDAAIEAADVVLMADDLNALIEVIDVAKQTKKIVWQNIFLALVVKGFFLVLGAFGIATMWEAVFSDVGVTLLAVLNALRLLKSKKLMKYK